MNSFDTAFISELKKLADERLADLKNQMMGNNPKTLEDFTRLQGRAQELVGLADMIEQAKENTEKRNR